MAASSAMYIAQLRQIQALNESMGKLELEGSVIKALSTNGICSFLMSDPSQSSTATTPNRSKDAINATSITTLAAEQVSIARLPASTLSTSTVSVASVGALASANSSTLFVSSMKFQNFRNSGIDQYLADFVISFDSTRTVRPLRPITITNLNFNSNPSDPAATKSIINCSAPRGAPPELHRYSFTSSGTWTVPAGVKSGFVTIAGGGGSGFGWRVSSTIQTGHSGGYIASAPVSLIPGEVLTITVGAGAIAYAPVQGAHISGPYYIFNAPAGDDGLGGYPGGLSSVVSPTAGTLIECAGGSGAYTAGMDTFAGPPVAGNMAGATYGSGSPPYPAPNRVAAGIYATAGGPGRCGPGPGGYGIGNNGVVQWFFPSITSGSWIGGLTPFGYGAGGNIHSSGCYVTTTIVGTCVSPSPGRDGIVIIDALY